MSKNARRRRRSQRRAAGAAQDNTGAEEVSAPHVHGASSRPSPAQARPRLALIAAGIGAGLAGFIALLMSPAVDVAGVFSGADSSQRAVIVDQLSATQPNQGFADSTTAVLEGAGYSVDYYSGDEVTVDLYRRLPEGNYDLVILRTHSTADVSRGEEEVTSVSLFTNEPYTKDRYYDEQLEARVGFAQYEEGGPRWFGITSAFVKESMKGDFDDALVIGMGCQGLVNELAAEAFAAKGASAFIGWDRNVSAEHTDKATERLLQLIVGEGLSPEEATAKTMRELGPDPYYGGSLVSRS
jgi:hypothetical protein